MDDKELIECGPIEAMRLLTAMFEPKSAVNRCAMVNLICRYLQGSAEHEFVLKILEEKCRIKLLRNEVGE